MGNITYIFPIDLMIDGVPIYQMYFPGVSVLDIIFDIFRLCVGIVLLFIIFFIILDMIRC